MDQIAALADPEKNLVPTLGFWDWRLTRKSRRWRRFARPVWNLVGAGGRRGREVPLNAGDVIRTLNGQPMTTTPTRLAER